MSRILAATFALFFLAGAAALHAQVPYTSSPYPWAQQAPPQQSPLMRPSQPALPGWIWEPTPTVTPRRRQRRQPQQLFQWDYPKETHWDRMRRENQQRMDRTSDWKRREFQAEAQERATRCAVRGSRKVFADCFN